MFTETELRTALQQSARRADTLDLLELPRVRVDAEVSALAPSLASRHADGARRRLVLPAAAAAAVITLAVGVLALRPDHAPSSHLGSSPAASTAVHHAPAVKHSTTPAPRPDQHVAVDISNAIDLVQAAGHASYYTLGGNGDPQLGTENVYQQFTRSTTSSTGSNIVLDIVDQHANFDPTRIPRSRPVPILGTTGYYSKFKLFPIDANTGPGSDKYLAHWSIVFRTPAGNWAFAYLEVPTDVGSVDDPTAIANAVHAMHPTFVAGRTRLPYRTGYLPAGLRVSSIMLAAGESFTYLRRGARSVEIDILNHRAAGDCAGPCGSARRIGTHTVDVTVTGYSRAAQLRILGTLTLADNFDDPSTWFTVARALG